MDRSKTAVSCQRARTCVSKEGKSGGPAGSGRKGELVTRLLRRTSGEGTRRAPRGTTLLGALIRRPLWLREPGLLRAFARFLRRLGGDLHAGRATGLPPSPARSVLLSALLVPVRAALRAFPGYPRADRHKMIF